MPRKHRKVKSYKELSRPRKKKAKLAAQKMHLSPFALRAVVLKRMGFTSYAAYLKSDLWQEIRLRVLDRDNCQCRYCGNEANQAHHRNYRSKTMNGVQIVDILSICGDCHRFISVENGRNCSMEKMKRKTLELVKMVVSSARLKPADQSSPLLGVEFQESKTMSGCMRNPQVDLATEQLDRLGCNATSFELAANPSIEEAVKTHS